MMKGSLILLVCFVDGKQEIGRGRIRIAVVKANGWGRESWYSRSGREASWMRTECEQQAIEKQHEQRWRQRKGEEEKMETDEKRGREEEERNKERNKARTGKRTMIAETGSE